MTQIIKLVFFGLLFLLYSCSGTGAKAPMSLTWTNEGYNSQSGYYDNTFVIKNISEKTVGKDWVIYFSQLPREIKDIQTNQIMIEEVNANYFKIYPTDQYKELASGDSIIVKYSVTNNTPNISQQPEGCYWVSTTSKKESIPYPVDLIISPLSDIALMKYSTPNEIYDFNKQLKWDMVSIIPGDILPSVKKIENKAGRLLVPTQVSLQYSKELANEADILKLKLRDIYNIEVVDAAPISIRFNQLANDISKPSGEWYKLDIGKDQILIESITTHGIFNGTQTLLALLKGKEPRNELPCMTITDYPDMQYRGFMIDVARNFTSASDLKKMIDVLASYKLNVLHLHFSDDEGWRLQIPGLEELTEVGGRRGHTTNEAENLFPGYDGGFDPQAKTSGNGYYTREEFIDILRYAADRHVKVLPEIESPGHARAAIVAMKARYNKYAGVDDQKAREYLLSEAQDTSVYVSAQSYRDNVMNVALPSTYRFMEKVITEIKAMYTEAGVELQSIHIGGDEVPAGSWMGSPAYHKLMKEKELNTTHDLFEYFYRQMAICLQKQGLKLNGWQEVALHNSAQTDKQLLPVTAGIHCWNTVSEWGDDEIPYKIANKGYPVILCNVNNFYLDLAYNRHYEERGHSWAGHIDESKSFSMLPYSVYRSSRTDIAGNPMDLDELAKGKEILKAENRHQILGIQAQLFTETIRGFDWVEYYVFPKLFGLVERGWNAHPVWEKMRGDEEQKAFTEDLAHFYTLISDREMPYLNHLKINFRLGNPGLNVHEDMLYANTTVRGATIHYTTDGREPTFSSPIWTSPVKCEGATTFKACIYYLGKKSLTTTLITQK